MMTESFKELLIKYHTIETQFWAMANIWSANQANIMKALAPNSHHVCLLFGVCLRRARQNLATSTRRKMKNFLISIIIIPCDSATKK
jgi:hypothetical protein